LIGLNYNSNIFNRIKGLDSFAHNVYFERLDKDIVDLVISDRLLFASMSYQLKNLDLSFHMPHEEGSKITNHFKLTSVLRNNMERNFIFIGFINEINYLENNFNIKKRRVPQYKFTNKDINVYEIYFN
jgi:hypothetical protein